MSSSSFLPKLHFKQGIYPIFKQNLLGETKGWFWEILSTIAIPLSFYLAFGLGLRANISDVDGLPYMVFITPGLVALTIQLEAYRTGAWGLWLSCRHHQTIHEYRIKPISMADIILGEILSGFIIALLKGALVGITLFLLLSNKPISLQNFLSFLSVMFPGAVLFTCLGAVTGVSFMRPDQIAQSQAIVITPLLYLGGLFFPVSRFPEWVFAWIKWLPTTAIFDGGRQAFLNGTPPTEYLILLYSVAIPFFLFTVWYTEKKLKQ